MEIELKLPHAENYRINPPKKTRQKKALDEYVRKVLMQEHPGFNKDSLWDYRIYKAYDKKMIIASVVLREFYIEKRVTDRKAVFFVRIGNESVRLFERFRFDEKGGRKSHKKICLLLLIIFFAAGLLIVFTAFGNKKKEVVAELPVTEEKISDAMNVFYLTDRFSSVIKDHKGVIKHFSFNAENKAVFVLSLYGCEAYSLLCDLEEEGEGVTCLCENVIYEDKKESYEIRIEKKDGMLLQKNLNQKELFQIQSRITKELGACDIKLISGGTDERNGRISFQMECQRKNLKGLNEKLNEICLENSLFPASFSESKTEGADLFLIKLEFIALEDVQKISPSVTEEKLSEIFEKDKENPEEKRRVQTSYTEQKPKPERSLKKIGSVKKDGKVYYYYRTKEGKIETSEVDYE